MAEWMTVGAALQAGTTEDKLAIAAACIEEEALMRTALIIAGQDGAPRWYAEHGGRFRFSEDDELMVQVPVPPFALNR
jgi:hypothetical protein